MKTPVITSQDYIVYLEPYQQYNFIHCDCYKWSKQVKHSLVQDITTLANLYRKDIYCLHELGDNKHLKFIKIFDFTYVQDVTGFDNITRQLFVRKYNGN